MSSTQTAFEQAQTILQQVEALRRWSELTQAPQFLTPIQEDGTPRNIQNDTKYLHPAYTAQFALLFSLIPQSKQLDLITSLQTTFDIRLRTQDASRSSTYNFKDQMRDVVTQLVGLFIDQSPEGRVDKEFVNDLTGYVANDHRDYTNILCKAISRIPKDEQIQVVNFLAKSSVERVLVEALDPLNISTHTVASDERDGSRLRKFLAVLPMDERIKMLDYLMEMHGPAGLEKSDYIRSIYGTPYLPQHSPEIESRLYSIDIPKGGILLLPAFSAVIGSTPFQEKPDGTSLIVPEDALQTLGIFRVPDVLDTKKLKTRKAIDAFLICRQPDDTRIHFDRSFFGNGYRTSSMNGNPYGRYICTPNDAHEIPSCLRKAWGDTNSADTALERIRAKCLDLAAHFERAGHAMLFSNNLRKIADALHPQG